MRKSLHPWVLLSVGTVWRHEKVGRIVMVFKCLREESIYNVGASLYRLAAGRWDERWDGTSGSLVLTVVK
jgi:hypothetical protein